MGLEILNAPMLWGLAGLSLPVLAHLLSRKRYDVQSWGAMQFLELEKNARRHLRLEELLLLLLRMGLVALLALALSRPAASGGFLASLVDKTSRDVVIVLDGSYSMGWRGGNETPHAAGIQWVHRFLESLAGGDRVALLDARDRVRPVIEEPTINFDRVRGVLNDLPPPSGTSDLAEAVRQALGILRRGSNVRREVIVVSDGQALGWHADDGVLWDRIDDLLGGFPETTRPRVWAAVPREPPHSRQPNFRIAALEISRELVAAGLPVRLRSTVAGSGNNLASERRVHLEVDGQRLGEQSLTVRVPAGGETVVEFEQRLPSPGSHRLAIVLDDDPLPGDNRAEAAVVSVEALPVLVADGDPQADPTRSETFFVRAALSAVGNKTPWVATTAVPWDQFRSDALATTEVVILANVPRLEPRDAAVLADFVRHGGGLVLALGDQVDADSYNDIAGRAGLLPVVLRATVDAPDDDNRVHPSDRSLRHPWLDRFRANRGGGFTDARFSRWWTIGLEVRPPGGGAVIHEPAEVLVRLSTGDALLVTGRLGRGRVAVWTSSLDVDWNTLPARPDYVSFLHELLFHVAGGRASRNVAVGEPLQLPVAESFAFDEHVFSGPGDLQFDVERGGDELRPVAQLSDTRLAGVYALGPRDRQRPGSVEHFVVNFDRRESDLSPLDEAIRRQLSANTRMTFVESIDELERAAMADAPRTELWHLILVAFLGLLVGEVLLTRRMVRGGYIEQRATT